MAIHAYCRTSTAKQSSEDRTSLAEQERACRAVAALRGEENPTVWIDAATSGSIHLSARPEGRKLLDAIDTGDTLIATKLDRLFRSAKDALEMAEAFKDQGIDLIIQDIGGVQPIMTSPVAKMFFTILAAVAEFERGRINERTADGKAARAALGGSVNRPPYGWKSVDKMLVVNEDEMKMVRFMRRLYAGGKNFNQIAIALHKRGYRNRKEKRMDPRQVAAILRRPEHPAELEFEERRRHPNGKPVEIAMPHGEAPLLLPAPPPPPKTKEEIIMAKLRESVKGERLLEAMLDAPTTSDYERALAAATQRYGLGRIQKLMALVTKLNEQTWPPPGAQ